PDSGFRTCFNAAARDGPRRPGYKPASPLADIGALLNVTASTLLDGRTAGIEDRGTAMGFRTLLALGFCLCVLGGIWAPVDAQRAGAFMGSSDDPAIRYSTAPLNNAVVEVNKKLQ